MLLLLQWFGFAVGVGGDGPSHGLEWWSWSCRVRAPQEFYIILNVAVGGTSDYFPDGVGNKPWNNADPHAVNSFYDAVKTWYPTWQKVRLVGVLWCDG